MDRPQVANDYRINLINFLRERRYNRYTKVRTEEEIIDYLYKSNECIYTFNCYQYNTKLSVKKIPIYLHDLKITSNMIILIFPYDGVVINTTYNGAEKIAGIPSIINETFSERPIKYRYINNSYIQNGAKIIVSTLPIESIVISDNDTSTMLKDLIDK